MKILETPRYYWKPYSKCGHSGDVECAPSKRNVDGPELLKWMRQLTKIKAFGLVEVPLYKTDALARFVDTNTLKGGHYVLFYKVTKENGILRNWVSLSAPRFGNDGKCSQLSGISEASLMKSVLKYKDGKRVEKDGQEAIDKFIKKFKDTAKNGGDPEDDFLKNYLAYEHGIMLKDKYTLDDVKEAMKKAIPTSERSFYYDKTYGGLIVNENRYKVVKETFMTF